MTSSYESVAEYQPFVAEAATSGSGGETLRGGFAYDLKGTSAQDVQKRIHTIFHSADWLLTEQAIESFSPATVPWTERDGFTALDHLYLSYRTGRWIVGSHSATLMNSLYYHPYFDNRVVRAALHLPAEWRHTEEPFYRIICMLAPALANVPPEGKRWRFEADGPRRVVEWPAWRKREAVVPKGRTAGFNWRRSRDEALLGIFEEQILDGPKAVFDIVERGKIEELLADLRSGAKTGWVQQLWHVFTMSVLLDGAWLKNGTPAHTNNIDIPIP
jgi:hypothetical protein